MSGHVTLYISSVLSGSTSQDGVVGYYSLNSLLQWALHSSVQLKATWAVTMEKCQGYCVIPSWLVVARMFTAACIVSEVCCDCGKISWVSCLLLLILGENAMASLVPRFTPVHALHF